MKALLLTSVLLTIPAFAQGKYFERQIPVSEKSEIHAHTNTGYLHVHPGPDSQIRIKAQLHANPGASSDVDSRIDRIIANPIFSVPKGTLLKRRETLITTGQKLQPDGGFGDDIVLDDAVHKGEDDLYKDITLDLDITLPQSTRLFANTGSGDLDIQSPGSNLSVTARSGAITVNGNPQAAWSIVSQSGSIDVTLDRAAAIALLTRTLSGTLRVDLPLDPPAGTDGHSLVGANHPERPAPAHIVVSVQSQSGNIVIR